MILLTFPESKSFLSNLFTTFHADPFDGKRFLQIQNYPFLGFTLMRLDFTQKNAGVLPHLLISHT
ncbi:hypothetical protein KSF_104790 [Reticulibacter mediterranei]|uniref:Uncharacterized protein n=1 Tax=Reticulibacter mediterranei TaxID=2778369 RepID=A0A8J3J481_9CHLR|nr:hypothetical protein KSF_104790 [Reticulibacter mediterranei]